MKNLPHLIIREPSLADEQMFLTTMRRSQSLHVPWVTAPLTAEAFHQYINRSQQLSHKSYIVCEESNHIIGVFNINEIVRGVFQSAYLGFYSSVDYAGRGYISAALKLVLNKIFEELELHRIEANIQPTNIRSINLVKKNGFREEGYSPRYLKINDIWCDHIRFAMTFEDWKALNC